MLQVDRGTVDLPAQLTPHSTLDIVRRMIVKVVHLPVARPTFDWLNQPWTLSATLGESSGERSRFAVPFRQHLDIVG